MAYSIMPDPGSKYLCAGQCKHLDCEELRKTAETSCLYCGKAIGYGSAWMNTVNDKPVHAKCAWEAVEAKGRR